jgi:hypothetical protein
MWQLSSALRLLAAGEFIDDVRFRDEFDVLAAPAGRQKADEWLGAIGLRLVEVEPGGAMFAAHAQLDLQTKAAVREEMRNLRQKVHPAVQFLETIRQGQGRAASLRPGDSVMLDELMSAVRSNAAFDQRLQDMKDLWGARTSENSQDRLERIVGLLVRDGYLKEENPTHKVYLVTGKVTWLYQLLALMNENLPQMQDEALVDQMEQQLPLAADGGAPS